MSHCKKEKKSGSIDEFLDRFVAVDSSGSVVDKEVIPAYYQSWAERTRDCGCAVERCNRYCCSSGGSKSCHRNCGCRCSKDDYNDCLPFVKQIEKTDGFDIDVTRLAILVPLPPVHRMDDVEMDFANQLAVLAIGMYNHTHNADYSSVLFVKGNTVCVYGISLYYITFLARTEADQLSNEFEMFQAKLLDTSGATIPLPDAKRDLRVVLLCRQTPSNHQIGDLEEYLKQTSDQFFTSIVPEKPMMISNAFDQHQFYFSINYEQPLIFLRDILTGTVDKVWNDDILSHSHFNLRLMVNKPCHQHGWESESQSQSKSESESEEDDHSELDMCFDIDGPFTTIVPRPPEDDNVEDLDFMWKLAVLAIKRYNIVMDVSFSKDPFIRRPKKEPPTPQDDRYYKCNSFIKANVLPFGDYSLYYITFTASARDSAAEPQCFQAMVLDSPRANGGRIREVLLCRPRPL